eukprot:12915350-Prorocentrum_lima.AAC.1
MEWVAGWLGGWVAGCGLSCASPTMCSARAGAHQDSLAMSHHTLTSAEPRRFQGHLYACLWRFCRSPKTRGLAPLNWP